MKLTSALIRKLRYKHEQADGRTIQRIEVSLPVFAQLMKDTEAVAQIEHFADLPVVVSADLESDMARLSSSDGFLVIYLSGLEHILSDAP